MTVPRLGPHRALHLQLKQFTGRPQHEIVTKHHKTKHERNVPNVEVLESLGTLGEDRMFPFSTLDWMIWKPLYALYRSIALSIYLSIYHPYPFWGGT